MLYNRHYHHAGDAVRDFPVWFNSIRDEWTGALKIIHYVDDGFGNLIETNNHRQLLAWRYGRGQGH